jgi:hypothetical protein
MKPAKKNPHADLPCSWCKTIPSEAKKRHEGPHATWCPRYDPSWITERLVSEVAVLMGRKGGLAGRGAYLRSLTPEQRRAHQQKAAKASAEARKKSAG